MKVPGPDHPITITKNAKRVRVTFAGAVIADTTQALTLQEASYPAVQYIPRGDASYFTIEAGGKTAENAVWSYEMPFPAMAEIKEYLAFYPSRVDKIEMI